MTKALKTKKLLHAEVASLLQPWPRELPDGSCKNSLTPDMFSNPFTDVELEDAKKICAECPIRADCYSIGVNRADEGVYGGEYLYQGKPSVLPKYRRTSK